MWIGCHFVTGSGQVTKAPQVTKKRPVFSGRENWAFKGCLPDKVWEGKKQPEFLRAS